MNKSFKQIFTLFFGFAVLSSFALVGMANNIITTEEVEDVDGRCMRMSLMHEGVSVAKLDYELKQESEEDPKELYIRHVEVAENFRNKKLGTQLIVHAQRVAQEHQCNVVTLLVQQSNDGAQRLYERLGFVIKEQYFGFYKMANFVM